MKWKDCASMWMCGRSICEMEGLCQHVDVREVRQFRNSESHVHCMPCVNEHARGASL